MSQHDYNIGIQTPTALLADLNAVLRAIATNNSGATEPVTMYPFQWWADTTQKLLKIRNAANTRWVTVGKLDTANLGLALVNGSASKDFAVKNLSVAGQIKFSAGTSLSPDPDSLDCYHEGGFDISTSSCTGISFRGSRGGVIRGNYTRIGRLVHFNISIADADRGYSTPNGVDIVAGATLAISYGAGAPPRTAIPSAAMVITPAYGAMNTGRQALAQLQGTGGSSDLIFIASAISGQPNVAPPDEDEGIVYITGTYMTVTV